MINRYNSQAAAPPLPLDVWAASQIASALASHTRILHQSRLRQFEEADQGDHLRRT